MEVYILDSSYDIIAMIDEAESILWDKKYNEPGMCEIYTPCTEKMLSLLQKGNYVYRYDDDMFCKITKVQITTDVEQGDHIIATGADICTMLSGRIVKNKTVFKGTVANFIKQLLISNATASDIGARQITNLTVDDNNFDELTDTIEASVKDNDLLELIQTTCKAHNYGFRVSYNLATEKLLFSLYAGADKSTTESDEYVEFSPEFANILSSDYTNDDTDMKNVALVGYKDADESESIYTYYRTNTEPSGENRREIYVDATSQSREVNAEQLLELYPSAALSGDTYYITVAGAQIAVATVVDEKIILTNYAFFIIIRRNGSAALTDHRAKTEFSGNVDVVDTYEYKKDYDLGDIVKVKNEYGISASARIVSVLESENTDDGYIVEPTFEY